jgi:pimeloyl-ACP methyl ester carboxylesterase
VAPDMRGYGQTDRPELLDQYTLLHLVGDMVGLVGALGDETAVIHILQSMRIRRATFSWYPGKVA